MSETTLEPTRPQLDRYLRESFELLGIIERDELLVPLERHGAPAGLVELVAERVPAGARLTSMRVLSIYVGDEPEAAAGGDATESAQ